MIVVADKHFDSISGRAIYGFNKHDIVIERCTFANVGKAINLVECSNITIRNCAFWNITGGPPPGDPVVGNFVQVDKCDSVLIEDCWGVNVPGQGNPEDIISVFQSTFVTVRRNQFFGGGPSTSGSGIMTGDGGGSDIDVYENVLFDTGNAGIGVAAGERITATDNDVLNQGLQSESNVGIYVWNIGEATCGDITVTGNRIEWHKADGTTNPLWNGGGCDLVVIADNTLGAVYRGAFNPSGYYGWEG